MRRAPVIFGCCAVVLAVSAVIVYTLLPERVASNFDAQGAAHAWQASSSVIYMMLAVGLGVPAFVAGLMFLLRFMPPKYLNVPNPVYWRATENHSRACDFLFRSSLLFGSGFMLWQVAFSVLLVAANQKTPPQPDTTAAILVSLAPLVLAAIWVGGILIFFLKPKGG